jgi:hypothetical protein
MPWFVTCAAVNFSHQASLIRKNKEHYAPLFTNVPKEFFKYSYIWTGELDEDQIKSLRGGDLNIQKYAKLIEA